MAPEIIAHRGTPREHRENTLPAFRRALELGVDGIELDVHATRDGTIVVHHDAAPAGAPPIATLTASQLARFNAAPGVPIPTLAEVLAVVAGQAMLYVEIKGAGIARLVTNALRQARCSRCAIHSFDHRTVREAGALAPGLRTGILLSSYLADPVAAMRAAGASDLWQRWDQVDALLVDRVHDAGGRVIAWTVNEPTPARDLARIGVDGLCSDAPDETRRALETG